MDLLARVRPTTPRGALQNAQEAMATLATAVADRLTLTSRLDAGGTEGPGELHALTREQCYELLSQETFGRLAYVARQGVPDIVPVNYVLHGNDILIQSGPGPKLQAAERRDTVAFEVDVIDAPSRSGRSVVVIGRAEVLNASQRRRLDSTLGKGPWAVGPRHTVIRVRPRRVTGRRLS